MRQVKRIVYRKIDEVFAQISSHWLSPRSIDCTMFAWFAFVESSAVFMNKLTLSNDGAFWAFRNRIKLFKLQGCAFQVLPGRRIVNHSNELQASAVTSWEDDNCVTLPLKSSPEKLSPEYRLIIRVKLEQSNQQGIIFFSSSWLSIRGNQLVGKLFYWNSRVNRFEGGRLRQHFA